MISNQIEKMALEIVYSYWKNIVYTPQHPRNTTKK